MLKEPLKVIGKISENFAGEIPEDISNGITKVSPSEFAGTIFSGTSREITVGIHEEIAVRIP